jgi:hypothetical protein
VGIEAAEILCRVMSHHPDGGDEVGLRKVGVYKSFDADVCLTKLYQV